MICFKSLIFKYSINFWLQSYLKFIAASQLKFLHLQIAPINNSSNIKDTFFSLLLLSPIIETVQFYIFDTNSDSVCIFVKSI